MNCRVLAAGFGFSLNFTSNYRERTQVLCFHSNYRETSETPSVYFESPKVSNIIDYLCVRLYYGSRVYPKEPHNRGTAKSRLRFRSRSAGRRRHLDLQKPMSLHCRPAQQTDFNVRADSVFTT